MADGTVVYVPQAVLVPPDAGVERTFGKYRLSAEQDAFCDHETVFCDVFVSPDGSLCCIGPPFGSLGKPTRVSINGRRRRFRVEIPATGRVFALVRVPVDDREVDSPLRVDVDFRSFSVSFTHVPDLGAVDRVDLMLGTIQKDNHPLWIRDWCMWHSRVHGVERIVIYDNGSADRDDVYAELARRVKGPELVVVAWDYPFGPAAPHGLKFAKAAGLNHCRLFFGPYTHWCINLDVDEYLFNTGSESLAPLLGRVREPQVRLPSYIVPMAADNRPGRCFDSPLRSAGLETERGKYLYRAAGTAFNEVHELVPRRGWLSRFVRTVAKRVLRAVGVDPGRFLAGARRVAARTASRPPGRHGRGDTAASDEPALFFFHFRALNTGWKYPRRAVPVHPDEPVHDDRVGTVRVIRDERIAAMRAIVERGRGTFPS